MSTANNGPVSFAREDHGHYMGRSTPHALNRFERCEHSVEPELYAQSEDRRLSEIVRSPRLILQFGTVSKCLEILAVEPPVPPTPPVPPAGPSTRIDLQSISVTKSADHTTNKAYGLLVPLRLFVDDELRINSMLPPLPHLKSMFHCFRGTYSA